MKLFRAYPLYDAIEKFSSPHELDGDVVELGVVGEKLVDVDHVGVLQGSQDAHLHHDGFNVIRVCLVYFGLGRVGFVLRYWIRLC